ncbi:MAG: DUF1573 domain-containing protein [Betaproteobacteria bacterium]|nr:DUF1573 domain-containing protein [Betaproteobacteria bacterium]
MTRSATVAPRRSINRNLILAAVAIAVALAIAIMAAKPGAGPAPSTRAAPAAAAPDMAVRTSGALKARESAFDFGPISMAAGKVSHRYWFRNEGVAPVLVRRIYTSCMCTTAALVKGARVIGRYGMPGHGPMPDVNETFAPGEAAYVDVVFDPAAHGPAGLGRTERVVTIEHGAGEPLQIGFTADVKP